MTLHAGDVTYADNVACAGGVTFTKISQNFRRNITQIVIKNVTHCFILNRKELPTHWLIIASVFCDVVCDVYVQSSNVSHFRRGHVVIETPIKHA